MSVWISDALNARLKMWTSSIRPWKLKVPGHAGSLRDVHVDARVNLSGRNGSGEHAVVEHAVDIDVERSRGRIVDAGNVIPGVGRQHGRAVPLNGIEPFELIWIAAVRTPVSGLVFNCQPAVPSFATIAAVVPGIRADVDPGAQRHAAGQPQRRRDCRDRRSSFPAKPSALPYLPVVQVGPLTSVPVLLLPRCQPSSCPCRLHPICSRRPGPAGKEPSSRCRWLCTTAPRRAR